MADPTAVQRRGLAKLGYAMPDGSYYIRAGSVGASDLQNAIDAVGRGEPQSSHNAIRVHIMKRAKALGLSDKIPADWQADGSLKHGVDQGQRTDDFLEHFGILGMRWGHHLPGVEVLGGPGNGDSNGSRKPAPFIQPGDHTGDKPGDSGPSDQGNRTMTQQAEDSVNALKALRDRVSQATDAAGSAAENASAADKKQATAVHDASKKHLANVALLHNKAKAAHDAHKTNVAKLGKHSNKAVAKRAIHAATKLHAGHMNHLARVAHEAHRNHLAHVGALKVKTKVSQLNAHDKAELAKLSPAQRSALKKLTPAQRADLARMTSAQKAKLSHLTQAERTALSHLSPKQLAALAKATSASAKKRHQAAVDRKGAAQTTNSANHSDLDVGDFLEHFGVKGMKWGVRRNGGHPGAIKTKVPADSSADHQQAALIRAKVKQHGGIHALSNNELRVLSDRLNLEANYHRLNPQTGNLEKARKFVRTATSDTKTILDAVDTGRRVVNLAKGAQPSGSRHQSQRTRNKPLKVVSINAA